MILAVMHNIHARQLMHIEFVYMKSGHSFILYERSFGVIKESFCVSDVHTTRRYEDYIRGAASPPHETIAMHRQDSYDLKTFAKFVTKR